jgi:hypothetical protein
VSPHISRQDEKKQSWTATIRLKVAAVFLISSIAFTVAPTCLLEKLGTMLQETLEKSTYSPAELALMLTSYVESELPAGGASAEKRFFELFPTLCERVFGVISTNSYMHELGGWMSRDRRWDYQTASSSKLSTHQLGPIKTPKTLSLRSDPVVLLLGTGRKTMAPKDQNPLILIDAFAKEAEHRKNVRYDFPFLALPKSMQDDWLAVIQISMGAVWVTKGNGPSENSDRLFRSLIRASPREQVSLLMYQQSIAQKQSETQRRPLQLNPMFSSPNTARSPTSIVATDGKPKGDAPPKVLLSMLEYYLLVFIRFPLAAPDTKTTSTATTTNYKTGSSAGYGKTMPYGKLVYNELFKEYVDYYVPMRETRGPFDAFSTLERPSELFVRFITALWMESRNRVDATSKACAMVQDRRGANTSLNLCASFDLVKSKYQSLPSQVSRCLSQLVNRVIIDANVANISERISSNYNGREDMLLCLSPAMEILQVPFYNHIRSVFRHAPIHSTTDLTFYYTLNDWLMWLEPWNTQYMTMSKSVRSAVPRVSKERNYGTRYVYPKVSQPSKYSNIWEAYITSNLHFYTTPLALFLRRARELDFSQRDYKKSVNTVMKVLRVFSKEVVDVINRMLQQRNCTGMHSLLDSSAKMIKLHEMKLGTFAPPDVEMTLFSLQDDVKNLLEEIYLQQQQNAKQVNALERWIDNTFGAGLHHKEEKDLHVLTDKAKIIFGFPPNYEVSLKDKSEAIEALVARDGETRTSEGFYSEAGLLRVSQGDIKCKPEEIVYVGDRMHARPQSYEMSFLVPLLIKLSVLLNNRLGLENTPKPSYYQFVPKRFNLRFLADMRNLGFVVLVFLWWLIN